MKKDSSKEYAVCIVLVILFYLYVAVGVDDFLSKTAVGHAANFIIVLVFGAVPMLVLFQGLFFDMLSSSKNKKQLVGSILRHFKSWFKWLIKSR